MTYEEVAYVLKEFGAVDAIAFDGGGYLCSSSHSLGQDIPWHNILAFVETVREYGHP